MNERRVRREIEHGADTLEDIAAACRAGSCCLSCHPTLDDLLAQHRAAIARPVVVRGRRLRFA